ncbi:response regulator [Mucilaginibacter aquaedulcis]|uniref:response regulator n=1 Tax=Mucilaginibacter aquaedulcis TaxID=1187081 RepID=UPI0025B4328B|nr:response regulator [Mucilaginibacter aquaedulcis]MDN3551572.1 response regulator [Mucilaginibacter aquaedulcis]
MDDDDDIRNMIYLILEGEGYEVSELADGHSVNSTVDDFHPDVILLDVMLGDMDGRDICRELKLAAATEAIPIIMVSASHQQEVLKDGGCRANDYLAKPFDIDVLIQKVGFYAAA